MSRHDCESIEFGGNLALWLFGSIIPKLKVPTHLMAPIRRHVVKKIQHAIHLPVFVVGIIEMGIKKIVFGHQTYAAGVEMIIRYHPLNTRNFLHQLQDPMILERENDLFKHRGIFVHLSGNIFILTKALLQHHRVLIGKSLEYFKDSVLWKNIVYNAALNGMLVKFVAESHN